MTTEEPYYTSTSIHRELLPSSLARSPPGRSSTLPPAPRSVKPNNSRPRKPSVGQNARKGKHERQKSKDHHRRMSYDRKAYSAEPQTAAAILGKRWEDLIDAAASATEEDSRDLTPVSIQHRSFTQLTPPDAPVPLSFPSREQSHFSTTLHSIATPFIHSITIAKHTDTAAARHVRPPAVPFGRVVYRVGHVGPKFPHALTRPVGLVPVIPIPCPDLLCRLWQAFDSKRKLRMF